MENNHNHDPFNLSKILNESLETLSKRNDFLSQQVPNDEFVKSHCKATSAILQDIYNCTNNNKLRLPILIANGANQLFTEDKELSVVYIKIENTLRKLKFDAIAHLYIQL